MSRNYIVIFITVCFTFCGCRLETSSGEIEKMVEEWVGRKIEFPHEVYCKSLNRDTLCVSPNSTPYKILVYTDSTGCVSCKLELFKWNKLMKEANDEMQSLINFQFYFHPKNIEEILFILRRDMFKYPSHIDIDNRLNKLNGFPENRKFHTFLLDKNNRVLAVGNPVDNPHIWELYKQIIKGGDKKLSHYEKITPNITSVKIDKEIQEIKGLMLGRTSKTNFNIKNIGVNPLIISNVQSSCGCTVPGWNKKPVMTHDSVDVTVQITPNNKGFFRKTIVVSCNVAKKDITLVIKGIVK